MVKIFIILFCSLLLTSCNVFKSNGGTVIVQKNHTAVTINNQYDEPSNEYGVFIGYDANLSFLKDYETVVIDAQYYTEEDIRSFKERGHTVYTYLNIGSLEDFRPYYDDYKNLTLSDYEHWKGEKWVDVSSEKWQSFILEELVPELLDKGIDGFFVDNCDVYFLYEKKEILDGLSYIMRGLIDTGEQVIINGGDTFLDAYTSNRGSWDEVMTGINQESVFSSIDWKNNTFNRANEENQKYFKDYIEQYGSLGADIYILEYTTDDKLIKEIEKYCSDNGFYYYISDSLELDF